MQIVIDIDDELYKSVINNDAYVLEEDVDWILLENAIANGTPLPKGHGRLIDAEKIANDINALKDNWNRYRNEYESGRYESYDYAVDTIEDAPTIIEADKEGDNNDTYT